MQLFLHLNFIYHPLLKDEPELRCTQVPKPNCQELNRQSCQQVPVKDCQPRSRRVCSLVPTTSTKEIFDRKCTDNFRQVCNPVPKQVCQV